MLSSILLFFCLLFGIGYRDDFADFIVFPSSWSSSDSEIESINSIKTNTNYKKLRNKCQHVTFVISVQILKRRVKVVTGSIHGVLNIQAMQSCSLGHRFLDVIVTSHLQMWRQIVVITSFRCTIWRQIRNVWGMWRYNDIQKSMTYCTTAWPVYLERHGSEPFAWIGRVVFPY